MSYSPSRRLGGDVPSIRQLVGAVDQPESVCTVLQSDSPREPFPKRAPHHPYRLDEGLCRSRGKEGAYRQVYRPVEPLTRQSLRSVCRGVRVIVVLSSGCQAISGSEESRLFLWHGLANERQCH